LKTLRTDFEKDVDKQMRDSLAAFRKKHGRPAGIKDAEFWDISNTYMERHSAAIELRKKEEKREEEKKKREEENPVFSDKKVVSEKFCKTDGCENIILPTGKRGRPPTKCESCRKK
jgi:3-methyladenine DNA glycosylase AlkD